MWTDFWQSDWQSRPWVLIGLESVIVLALALFVLPFEYALADRLFGDRVLAGHLIRRTRRPMQLAAPMAGLEIVFQLAPDTLEHINLLRSGASLLLIAALTFTSRPVQCTGFRTQLRPLLQGTRGLARVHAARIPELPAATARRRHADRSARPARPFRAGGEQPHTLN